MWDMSIVGVVPGLHLAAPRDGQQIPLALRAAVDISDAPSVIRFPKGSAGDAIAAVRSVAGVDVLFEPDAEAVDLLLVGIGSMAATALTVADKLTAEGLRVRVVDPVWALPVNPVLGELAGAAGRVAVVEDNSVSGGVGSHVVQALRDSGSDVPVDLFGLPREFLDHGSRGQVLDRVGLTPEAISAKLLDALR
jgi:1-deoxy-D-xylulose-5-phosphate synthase